MSLRDFISKQLIDVIDWTEPEDGILAYRYPMQDREIQNGGKLTVRDSQLAVFVNEGKVADAFAPGLYTLNTNTLPILTYLKNWDKKFQSPFKSDVYFFSSRIQTDQHWGTQNPITIRDKEFGAIRLRGFGIYSYHITDAKNFLLENQRHARPLSRRRSRRPVAQHHHRQNDGCVCSQPGSVSRHGRQPGRDCRKNQRAAQARVHRLRPLARQLSSSRISRSPKSFRKCSTSASA